MDIQNIYIPHEIVDIIFSKMPYENKKKIVLINKYLYKKYNKKIHFYRLDKYLNNDYIKFYKLLNKYNYKEDKEYLEEILNLSINNINTIWKDDINGYYDLRYLFELIYEYNDMIEILNFQDSYNNNNHIKVMIINNILLCIKSSRSETLKQINDNTKYLSSLKNDFNPKSKKNKIEWINLIE